MGGDGMKYIIGRPICDIPLNGLEYLLDGEDGEIMLFDSRELAEQHLRNLGAYQDYIDDYYQIISTDDDFYVNKGVRI